jgi:hypothetical protein
LIRRVLIAALAVLALAGCQTHTGTAAYVGDHRITTEQVDRARAGQTQAPRGEATQNSVNVLIQTELLRTVAADLGTAVSPSFIDQARADQQIQAQAAQLGVDPTAFGTLAAYFVSVQDQLARQISAGAGGLTEAQVAEVQNRLAALRGKAAHDHEVTVNPRYGTFDVRNALVTPAVEAGIKVLTPEPGQAPTAP